jgi:hypothetical protein
MPASRLAYSSTLDMEATYSSETSVDLQQITRRHFPEDKTPVEAILIRVERNEASDVQT